MYQVLVGKEYQCDVAKEHRISEPTVSILVKKAIKNKEFIMELVQMQQEKQVKEEGIAEAI